ncbi:mechanosensitive ion channel [Danxiaibacter flavus]|uniref:Mechanosensitive ion channel n=1 Tax=Danxiaibacter flavus TaxID=3049108 RepID=A0ABV3Z8Y3_9BACT|nr:mechanosensitive ion channel [Chitinophagaceae bacterium DXS]
MFSVKVTRCITKVFFLFTAFLLTLQVYSQKKQKEKPKEKQPQVNFVDTSLANKHLSDTVKEQLADTILPKIANKLETYSLELSRYSNFFKRRVDTMQISSALPSMEKAMFFFKGRLEKNDAQMNLRTLNTYTILLQEALQELTHWEGVLEDYGDRLNKSNSAVQHILVDPYLHTELDDTALNSQIKSLIKRAVQIDSLQLITLAKVNKWRNRISVNSLLATDMLADLGYRTINAKAAMWGREQPALYNARATDYKQTLWQSILVTGKRSFKVQAIYIMMTWDQRAINLFIFGVFTIWCFINYRKVKRSDAALDELAPLHFMNRSVLLSCIVAVLCITPYLYANPPMVYMHFNELVRTLGVSILLWPYLTRTCKRYWSIMFVIWTCFAIDDLFLETSFGERWLLLLLPLAGGIIAAIILRKKPKLFSGLEESPVTRSLAIFTVFFCLVSVLFNVFGRITLAKLFGMSAVQGFVYAMTLKAFSSIILEAVYLQSEAYKNSSFSAFLNYDELKIKLRRMLWVVTTILWLIALTKSLTIYDFLLRTVEQFFNKKRSIGNMQFSFMSVAIFVFVIWISTIISQFISFFFGSKMSENTNKRSNMGSVMLLVRLAVWAIGFLIAIAAAGIPLDKISLMIGALGVGIGFGLQNIVNNLVSGIILAFERPIQVGDLIEVGGKTGTVKEIGVRSSKISNYEGADIIVPNGDLLSQHLINWTLHNRNRRIEIVVGISYSADLRKAKEIIENILRDEANVMQVPAPLVWVNNFGDNSVDFRILFWTYDLGDAGTLRSDMMILIFENFAKEGIEIPYPQRDIYIKNMDEALLKMKEKEGVNGE